MDDIRTSYGMFIRRMEDPVITRIEKRISLWTHLPVDHQEDIQVGARVPPLRVQAPPLPRAPACRTLALPLSPPCRLPSTEQPTSPSAQPGPTACVASFPHHSPHTALSPRPPPPFCPPRFCAMPTARPTAPTTIQGTSPTSPAPSGALPPSSCTCLTWRRAARRHSPTTLCGTTPRSPRRWAPSQSVPAVTWRPSPRRATQCSSTPSTPTTPWTPPPCTPAALSSRASSGPPPSG